MNFNAEDAFVDCDDSNAQQHIIEPLTADEAEAQIARFFATLVAS